MVINMEPGVELLNKMMTLHILDYTIRSLVSYFSNHPLTGVIISIGTFLFSLIEFAQGYIVFMQAVAVTCGAIVGMITLGAKLFSIKLKQKNKIS